MQGLTKKGASINEFLRLYNESGTFLIEASKLLVELVSNHEDAFECIIEKCPSITYDTLFSLYQCGRIGLDPRRMLANPHVARALFTLPSKDAADAVKKGLPVVKVPGKLAELTPISELTMRDVRIAIADGKIRTNKEQTAFLDASKEVEVARYKIDCEGNVTFYKKITFTASQLMDVAIEAGKAAVKSLSKMNNQVK